MKFSTFTITVPDFRPREAAGLIKDVGFDGVAWRIIDQRPSDTPSFWVGNLSTWPLTGLEESLPLINEITTSAGLEIAAFYGYPRWSEHESVRRQFAAAASIGVKTCRFVGPGDKTPYGSSPQLGTGHYNDLFESSRRDFRWVADCARDFGVRAVTPLHHEWVNSSASASRRLLDGLDPAAIGIIADWGHLALEGWEDPLATVQILGPYLDSVMLKNFGWYPARKRADGTVLWESRPETLRDGRVDIHNVFAALNAEGFDGWVTIAEVTTPGATRDRLQDALDYVKAAAHATAHAKRDEWLFSYARGGGVWSGLDSGEELGGPR